MSQAPALARVTSSGMVSLIIFLRIALASARKLGAQFDLRDHSFGTFAGHGGDIPQSFYADMEPKAITARSRLNPLWPKN